eukprot:gene1347-1541_t
MGNTVSSMPEKMVDKMKIMQTDMMEKQLGNQIRLQDRMMKKQIAFQVAMTRERTYWFAGATGLVAFAALAQTLKNKAVPKMAMPPLAVLTLATAYQWDLGFNNKMNRVRDMAKENDKNRPLPFKFRLRRLLNWGILGMSYTAMYIGRYNFTLLTDERIVKDTSMSTGYGAVLIMGYCTYAICSPFTGSIGDFLGPKPVVVAGVIGSGFVNFILGLLLIHGKGGSIPILGAIPPVALFGIFNAINFFMQSLATGSVNKLNAGWYRRSETGVFGGIFSAILATAYYFTLNLGNMMIQSSLPWNFIFLLPGALLIISGALTFFLVKEGPSQCGYDVDLTDQAIHQSINAANIELDALPHQIDSILKLSIGIQKETMLKRSTSLQKVSLLKQSSEIPKESPLKRSSSIPRDDSADNNNNSAILVSDPHDDGADTYLNNLIESNISINNSEHMIGVNDYPSDHDSVEEEDHHDVDTSALPKPTLFQLIKAIGSEVVKYDNIKPLLTKDNGLNAIALFCIGWIKEGFIAYFTPFLKDKFEPDPSQAVMAILDAGVSLGAMSGGMICGLLSDIFFNSRRQPSLFIFFFLLNLLLLGVYFAANQVLIVNLIIVSLVIMFGTNNVLTITALLDLGQSKNASLMAGLLTTCQYAASGMAGGVLSLIPVDSMMLSMIPLSVIATIVMGYNSMGDLKFWKRWYYKLYHHETSTPQDKSSESQLKYSTS